MKNEISYSFYLYLIIEFLYYRKAAKGDILSMSKK